MRMTEFRSRVFRTASAEAVENWITASKIVQRACGKRNREQSGLEEAGGDAIVAVELHVIEGSGDSVPSGHRGGLVALAVSPCGQNYVSVNPPFSDENELDLQQTA